MATSVISHSEKRRRQRGEATLIERTIFYQGMVYQIEEEVYSDPDHSSVYTSEDSFDEDKKLIGKYIKENPVGEKPNKTDSRFDQTQSDFGKTFETMNKTSMSIGQDGTQSMKDKMNASKAESSGSMSPSKSEK